MPARLLESPGESNTINDGNSRAMTRVVHKWGNKLDLYQLFCNINHDSLSPRAPLSLSKTREKSLVLPPTPPRQAHPRSAASSSSPSMTRRLTQELPPLQVSGSSQETPLEWDWDTEHEDRRAEARADAAVHNATPFQVDRKLLKDIVQERMGTQVARIKFLGAGTFHKGYLVILVDRRELVARVARRFMPRLKTESEVATMHYLRQHTSIPVPEVYHYDANPYNRLGGEFILMSKASGIPLSQVFHSMPHNTLVALMENIAMLVIPLFGHHFPMIGSLYDGSSPSNHTAADFSSSLPTPTPATYQRQMDIHDALTRLADAERDTHIGPIVSWPFFGSGRGDLAHPSELNRGPWRSAHAYLHACADREISGVVLENEGKAAPHKLHLDPDEIQTSRHHRVGALPDDCSDASDEWDWEESEAEWDGPGATMYQDYRRMQRTTFLVAHLAEREERVKAEMARFLRMMERLGVVAHGEGDGGGGESDRGGAEELFSIDCHDLNLENVFVDENDNSKITCIIDWESTTTRPLWACAHVPSFLQNSPFTAKLFRATVEKLARNPPIPNVLIRGTPFSVAGLAASWLHHETTGARLRMAHRCIEWDGWEEGLVDSILGPEDQEEDWFKEWQEEGHEHDDHDHEHENDDPAIDNDRQAREEEYTSQSPVASISPSLIALRVSTNGDSDVDAMPRRLPITKSAAANGNGAGTGNGLPVAKVVVAVEKEREKLLNATGDFCGGRGGELGRRLEAWLYVNGDADGRVDLARRWEGDEED
ncbi:hypothetical protein GSI_10751 [Ganoderma sinense ZZ0214-1]|uniref:Altered inheritance of mitochondria protein 9, mitochondrial n=1 Tax=Ganoderma sinense ZZ0214-1 TaxID=1077348 RepID=A0A2G8S1E9_9APHY|nr:hypothetical protein GSI_10751 [Ganoderma sinense ZZ0214-1]